MDPENNFKRSDGTQTRNNGFKSNKPQSRQRGDEGLPTTITPSLSPPPLHHRCPLYTTGVNDGSFPSHSLDLRQCHQWKNRSCCTENTTRLIHESSPYNFNYDHCSRVESMSSECKRHFMLDHCFYKCSPNVGPWVVSENRSWRRERYWGVPLCAIDCELWFTACANDVTCTDNWTNNFRWLNMTGDCPTKGSCLTNYCPVNSTCQTFKEIYRTARNFCEKVWDNAWKYAEPTTPCMHLQFNQSAINPNDAVALHYAQIIAGSQMHSCNLMWFSIQLAVWAFINRILTVAS
ncbi:folate receptor gamma-like [Procambarus clarkii]|uniref:folate receptor gamma-like n=1 Tax=Procambarus clarkii TaxID=6728 RepID=UPI00374301EC